MRSDSNHRIQKLRQRYFLYQTAAIVLIVAGIAFILFTLSKLWSDSIAVRYSIATLSGLLALILLAVRFKLFLVSMQDFVRFLNQQYPSLQQSADLLIREDEELTNLERIQLEKVKTSFAAIYPEIKLPHRLGRSFVLFVVSVGLSFLFSSYLKKINLPVFETNNPDIENQQTKRALAELNSFEIRITPPTYTNTSAFLSKGFELKLPEGSNVEWIINFKGDVHGVKLIFSNRDSVLFKQANGNYVLEREFEQSGFYQLKWSDATKTTWSDFYRIEVIKDESPKITITNLNQFTRIKYSDSQEVSVASQLSDDYALTNAGIIATVSKGSGEGIKFREERLKFASPTIIAGKHVNALAVLDLKKLALEPGDELYFYIEAFDNKFPKPNRSRTETFFIALQDTTRNAAIEDTGLGVDLMPDYFRSQRQIIIDTEKLLKDKPKISKQQFNNTSNELGYDQKTLRLKYGQFLGEEEDSGIATDVISHEEESDDEEEDPMKKFGHQHDTKNEHNLVAEKKAAHSHTEESTDTDKDKDPLAAFVHSHDDSETATFFEQSLRAKLKAALTVMWDAELYLRLYQPEKSLPYQYTALKLLKEISNDSRIYVHRTGFEPPPLKEEKRLTADLSEVRNATNKSAIKDEADFPNVREALMLTEMLLQNSATQLPQNKQLIFQRAGGEFSAIVLEKPALLGGLSLLKKFADNQVSEPEFEANLKKLRTILWQSLPAKTPSPTKQSGASTQLDQLFIQELEGGKNE